MPDPKFVCMLKVSNEGKIEDIISTQEGFNSVTFCGVGSSLISAFYMGKQKFAFIFLQEGYNSFYR